MKLADYAYANELARALESIKKLKLENNPRTDEALFENVENDGDTILLDMRTSWWYSAVHTAPATLVSGGLTANRWKTKVLTYMKNRGMIWKVITGHTWVQESLQEKV
jgi:hypothetical protein